MPKYKD
ncbi:hypothetical protein VTH06DRAFT_1623 [Thermothelomyces fergusii]